MQPQCSLHCVICLDLGVKDAVKLQGEVVPYLHNLFSVRMRYAAKRYMKLVERQRERETEREREGGRERERVETGHACHRKVKLTFPCSVNVFAPGLLLVFPLTELNS